MLGNVRNGVAAEPIDEGAFHRNLAASEQLPFSFVYGGKPSAEFLGKWKKTVQEKAIGATKVQRIVTLDDPETKLQIRIVTTIYLDTPSVEWTIYLTNRGEKDTPILEQLGQWT